jgi:hypothetical protein
MAVPYNSFSATKFIVSQEAPTGPGGCSFRRNLRLVGPPSEKSLDAKGVGCSIENRRRWKLAEMISLGGLPCGFSARCNNDERIPHLSTSCHPFVTPTESVYALPNRQRRLMAPTRCIAIQKPALAMRPSALIQTESSHRHSAPRNPLLASSLAAENIFGEIASSG